MHDLVTEELLRKAYEVAALLNEIRDDDDRERRQELYERRLNDELFAGSEVRAMHDHDAARAELAANSAILAKPRRWWPGP